MAFRLRALVGARPSWRMQAPMSASSAAAMLAASGARRNSAGVHSFTFLSVVCSKGGPEGYRAWEKGDKQYARQSRPEACGWAVNSKARHSSRQAMLPLSARTWADSSTAQSSWKLEAWSRGTGGLGYSLPSSSAMRCALNSRAERLERTRLEGEAAARADFFLRAAVEGGGDANAASSRAASATAAGPTAAAAAAAAVAWMTALARGVDGGPWPAAAAAASFVLPRGRPRGRLAGGSSVAAAETTTAATLAAAAGMWCAGVLLKVPPNEGSEAQPAAARRWAAAAAAATGRRGRRWAVWWAKARSSCV
jgi:hypothetical protein